MQSTQLELRCWEGYDSREFWLPFADKVGASVSAETLISDAQAAASLLDATDACDVININNAYVQKVLEPAELIATVAEDTAHMATTGLLPAFSRFKRWMFDSTETRMIGIGQRFGHFNLVINTKRISRKLAEDEGFSLADERNARYGVLCYEDFNIFHIAIAAGLNPFDRLDGQQVARFEAKAAAWFANATLVSDNHATLNAALLSGTIDFYLSGGVYTVSPARRDGHLHLEAVTPRTGPINRLGGIAFAEITSILQNARNPRAANNFLQFMLQPQNAIRIAMARTTCNPVAQMGNAKVFAAFSSEDLRTLQWDTLEEDLSYCVDYDTVPNHAELHSSLKRAMATNL